MPDRPTKITFGEMRDMGVRGLLIYCADYRCSHSIPAGAHLRAGCCSTAMMWKEGISALIKA